MPWYLRSHNLSVSHFSAIQKEVCDVLDVLGNLPFRWVMTKVSFLLIGMAMVLLGAISPSLANDTLGGVWVESEGVFHLGDETTMELAQRASLEAARRAAIEKAIGMQVKGVTLVRNAQLIESLVHVVARGMIVEEHIVDRGLIAQGLTGAHATYRTRIRARVVKIAGKSPAANFSTKCHLNRSVYQPGEHAEVRVVSSQDAYLYMFDVTEDEHVTVLAPNRFLPEVHVRAGQEYVFPPEGLMQRGIRLTMLVAPGKARSTENIKVIATRQPIDALKRRAPEAIFDEYRPSDTSMVVDLLKTLAALDPDEWAECGASYDIVEKK